MRFTNIDRYGHFYTNKANCRNVWSKDGKKLEGEYSANQTLAIDGEAIDKLATLEDLEDELGIDLITLFKALKNGIYGKVGNKIEHILAPHLSWHNREIYIFKIEDYGKTWALTKEELL